MAITVTFTADTLVGGSIRTTGSTLSVADATARMLVDLGVATAPGLTPQTGSSAASFAALYANKANNLSDLASASTARTNLGLGAAATAAFATPVQSSQLTSTTLANNPQSILGNIFADTAPLRPVSSAFVAASSGTGASGSMYYATALVYCPNATISGYGGVYYGIEAHSPYSGARAIVNWTKTIGFTCFINRESAAWSNGMTIRVTIGKGASGGTLTTRGVGLDIVAGATYVKILAHNGTTLTTTDSTYAVSNLTGNYVKQMSVISYGNGTAELFVDGVSYGTTSGAPTTVGSSGQNRFSLECYGDGTQSGSLPVLFFHPKVISSL